MIEAVGYGMLVPASVAAGLAWLFGRLLRGGRAGRCLAVSGPAWGFLAGYALAVDGEWAPERNWHWLPYLAIGAACVGMVAAVTGPSSEQRKTLRRLLTIAVPALFLILSLAGSAALVPDWVDRTVQIPLFAGLLLVLLLLYDPLPQRVAAHSLVPLLSVCGFATAAFLAALISLTYAQLAGLATAAFAGAALVFWIYGEKSDLRGLLPAYVVLLEGAAWVGCSYPPEPIYGLLMAPAAPLVLQAFCCGPLSMLRGSRRALCEYGLVLLVLAASAVLLFRDSFGDSGSEW